MTATNQSAVTEQVHAVLAATAFVEDEGSFTQEAGITQRVRRAFPARGEAQPAWQWAAQLARELGHLVGWGGSAREVWAALSPAVPELKSFAWDRLAPPNQLKPGIATMPAGADGRPPGWREQGVPSMRGLTLPRETP
jgi:NADH-quinone oxidoreductase subunit G